MAKIAYRLGEVEEGPCRSLGAYEDFLPPPQDTPEMILDTIWSTAKSIWPNDTAKAEAWVREQAIRYGTAEIKSQAATVSQSSITWIILGVAVGWFLTRKR